MDKKSYLLGLADGIRGAAEEMEKQAEVDPKVHEALNSGRLLDYLAPQPIGGYVQGKTLRTLGVDPEIVGHPGLRRMGSQAAYGVLGALPGAALGLAGAAKGKTGPLYAGTLLSAMGTLGGSAYGMERSRSNFKKRVLQKLQERAQAQA